MTSFCKNHTRCQFDGDFSGFEIKKSPSIWISWFSWNCHFRLKNHVNYTIRWIFRFKIHKVIPKCSLIMIFEDFSQTGRGRDHRTAKKRVRLFALFAPNIANSEQQFSFSNNEQCEKRTGWTVRTVRTTNSANSLNRANNERFEQFTLGE